MDLLLAGDPLSRPRNPLLVPGLRDWPGGGYCERIGVGVRLMRGAMVELGLPPPVLREAGNEFVVSFYGPGGAPPPPPEPASDTERPVGGRPPTPPVLPGVRDPRLARLNSHQLQALTFVQDRGSISNADYRSLTATATRTAQRELSDLVDLRLLVRQGGGRSLRYVLPPV